jgi:hypothetical protein
MKNWKTILKSIVTLLVIGWFLWEGKQTFSYLGPPCLYDSDGPIACTRQYWADQAGIMLLILLIFAVLFIWALLHHHKKHHGDCKEDFID